MLPPFHQVEMCSMQPLDSGEGFVMELANQAGESIRLEFPVWMISQLMRALPRLDGALRPDASMPSGLVAYPFLDGGFNTADADTGLLMHLRNTQQVEALFHLAPAQAVALHEALGQAIARAALAAAAPASMAMN